MGSRILWLASSACILGSVGGGGAAEREANTIITLKREYLDCERKAVVERLPTDAVARCSEVYEELKRRAFDGDWKKVRAWAEANRATDIGA